MLKRVLSILCILIFCFGSMTVSFAELPPDQQRDEEGPGYDGTSAPSAGDGAYVYTANGKTLHLREKGKSDAKILREIPWGARVSVIKTSGSWTKVTYDGTTGWVVSKYLVSKRPTRKPSSSSSKKTSSTEPRVTPIPTRLPDSLSGMTDKDFDSSKLIALDMPEDVTVAPQADDETVPMFKRMSVKSKMTVQYAEGTPLQLTARNEDWGKVKDPSTGKTGYMLLDWLVSDIVDEEEILDEEEVIE